MSASHLLPQAKPADRSRANEPSMEEILASIRRIIADDQASPSGRAAEAPDAGRQNAWRQDPAKQRETFGERSTMPASQPAPAPNYPPARLAEQPKNVERSTERNFDKHFDKHFEKHYLERMANGGPVAGAERADGQKLGGFRVAGRLQSDVAWAERPAEPPNPVGRGADLRGSDLRGSDLRGVDLRGSDGLRGEVAQSEPRLVEPKAAELKREPPLVSPATDQAVSAAFNALVTSRLMPSDESLADMVGEMVRPMLKAWLDDNLPIMVERLVRAEIERVARGGR